MAARKTRVVVDRRAELVWMRERLRDRIADADESAAGVAACVRQLRAVTDEITEMDSAAKKKGDGLDEIAAQREKRKAGVR